MAYDSLDRPTASTTPAPGTGQPARTTTRLYDTLGRVTGVLLPDGASVTNEDSDRGELTRTHGAREYPVA